MPLLTFLIKNIYKRTRGERVQLRVPCRYQILTNHDVIKPGMPLKKAVIINASTRGFGLVTSPPLSDDCRTKIKKKQNKIYLEIFSDNENSLLEMYGKIRWIKTVKNIKKPFSEVGICLTSIKEQSRTEIVDQLFSKQAIKIKNEN